MNSSIEKAASIFLFISLGMIFFHAMPGRTETVFIDDFTSGILSPEWEVKFEEASDWQYLESNSRLTVKDITPTVINTESHQIWSIVTMSHEISPLDDFNIEVRFSWNSEDPSTGAQSDRAMQDLFLSLYDDKGQRILIAGYDDPWLAQSGQKYALTDSEIVESGYNTLPYKGKALVHVKRRDHQIQVFWNGDLLATGFSNNPLKRVHLHFGYYAMETSFFGTEYVDFIKIENGAASGPSSTLYYPHVASNDRWETEICAISTGTDAVYGSFLAYNNQGMAVSEEIPVALGTHARKEITVGEAFSDAADIGYIVFSSDSQDVTGYTKFYIDGQYRAAVPAVSGTTAGDLYISHIASTEKWWTGISLVNTEPADRELRIEFDDDSSRTVSLGPNEHKAFSISSLFGDTPQPKLNSAVIKNADGIVGLELFGNKAQLSGILLKNDTARNIYYPHIAGGRWWTGIVAYNPSRLSATLTILPYTADGTALRAETVILEGREKYIGNMSTLGLSSAAEWFAIEATRPITGFELFGTSDGGQLAGYTGVGISGINGIFPKVEKNGWTGIAFVNIGSSNAQVYLTAYDDIGGIVATKSISLGPREKMVDNPEDLFDKDISEATYIAYTANQALVGFQLNGDADRTMLDGLPGLR